MKVSVVPKNLIRWHFVAETDGVRMRQWKGIVFNILREILCSGGSSFLRSGAVHERELRPFPASARMPTRAIRTKVQPHLAGELA